MYRGEVTTRYVAVRAANLPPGAMVYHALGEEMAWTPGEYLMAAAIDALNGANWQRAQRGGKPPKPIDRPADVKAAADRKQRTSEKARAFRARQRNGGAA